VGGVVPPPFQTTFLGYARRRTTLVWFDLLVLILEVISERRVQASASRISATAGSVKESLCDC
jgi:hypothetical protein